jgi:2-C-methyl-D-erythritol 4-phosphate cytidylyltransferase/2-C-methyl-D-erythritol 2,4-cyclodiphosphate synthase
MSLFLILLAAGDGKRLKSTIPKAYIKVNNKTLLEHSINNFKKNSDIKKIIIVYNKNHKKLLQNLNLKNILYVEGGKTRQKSAFLALKKIKKMGCNKVLIHDVARPFTPKNLIKTVILELKKHHAVLPIINVNDAVKRVKRNNIFKNINRNTLRFSQTPQGFTFKKIYEKHKKSENMIIDDDASLFTKDNEKVKIITGSKKNIKITDKEDLDVFKSINKLKTYFGIGFDIHKLVKYRKLYLGGVKIPFKMGLDGHSDADPVLHALIDALLGACRVGDIGMLFSDKNKKFKNIRSTKLLKKVIKLISDNKYFINNIDINIIAQKPKINKYSKQMLFVISKICDVKVDQINIKGKSTEKLGIIGKEKAIASEVIVSVSSYE